MSTNCSLLCALLWPSHEKLLIQVWVLSIVFPSVAFCFIFFTSILLKITKRQKAVFVLIFHLGVVPLQRTSNNLFVLLLSNQDQAILSRLLYYRMYNPLQHTFLMIIVILTGDNFGEGWECSSACSVWSIIQRRQYYQNSWKLSRGLVWWSSSKGNMNHLAAFAFHSIEDKLDPESSHINELN